MSLIKNLKLSKSGDSGFAKRLCMKKLFSLKILGSFTERIHEGFQDNNLNLLLLSDNLA